MERWINLVGYQIAWLCSVAGAGHGKSWPAWAAASLLCGGHLIVSSRRGMDLGLMGVAVVLGLLIDGSLGSTGLLRYHPATPAIPISGCPSWILALWLAFSTTLTRSLGWLRGRTGWSLLFGAVGGPLAYWAAARGWHVIAFSPPLSVSVAALATGWALALVVLVRAAGGTTLCASPQRPPQGEPDLS